MTGGNRTCAGIVSVALLSYSVKTTSLVKTPAPNEQLITHFIALFPATVSTRLDPFRRASTTPRRRFRRNRFGS